MQSEDDEIEVAASVNAGAPSLQLSMLKRDGISSSSIITSSSPSASSTADCRRSLDFQRIWAGEELGGFTIGETAARRLVAPPARRVPLAFRLRPTGGACKGVAAGACRVSMRRKSPDITSAGSPIGLSGSNTLWRRKMSASASLGARLSLFDPVA